VNLYIDRGQKHTCRSSSVRFFRNSIKRSQTVRIIFGGAFVNESASNCVLSNSSSSKRICRAEYGFNSSVVLDCFGLY
jgi:hypothetical protein